MERRMLKNKIIPLALIFGLSACDDGTADPTYHFDPNEKAGCAYVHHHEKGIIDTLPSIERVGAFDYYYYYDKIVVYDLHKDVRDTVYRDSSEIAQYDEFKCTYGMEY